MVRPQVADWGKASSYGGYVWIYSIRSSREPTRGGPPSWGLGVGLTTPHRLTLKKEFVPKCFKAPRTWTDPLARTKQCKKDMRFGTWNVRSLYWVGAMKSAVGELEKYK